MRPARSWWLRQGTTGRRSATVGTVGGPAASEHVLTVGGIGATSNPRTAALELEVGPASAGLTGLPLIGPDPPAGTFPIRVLAGQDGLTSGDELRDYADARGRSRVVGAIAVVGRGGGTLATKARAAAEAGAVALGVWDQDGPGLFPGIRAGADVPIPVLGLGARQGRVLVENPRFAARIAVADPGSRPEAIASFSSRGPTADGLLEPDLVAPAVDVETAYPGPGGEPLIARMSGTSAAAAQVAAVALRVRVDRPELTPADVRSLLVQAAAPLPGVPSTDQGAGVVRMPGALAVSITPAVLSGRRSASAPTRLRLTLRNLTADPAVYRVALSTPDGAVTPPGDPLEVAPGAEAEATVQVPAGVDAFRGTALVLAADGATIGVAPVFAQATPVVPPAALGVPEIRVAGDVAEARVSVGTIGRSGSALMVAPLHRLGLWLVPAGGGAPIRMAGEKQSGDWPAGTYRFMLTRRQETGRELPAGRYRLRAKALGPDGVTLVRESRVFALR